MVVKNTRRNKMTTENILNTEIAKLFYIRTMLVKYSHRYSECNGEPSARMQKWIDSYNEARELPIWATYIQQNGLSINHDAFDLFA
jgi:hypothetical protein